MAVQYKIASEDKEFWGSEYLTRTGLLSAQSALYRLETYARVHKLSCSKDSMKLDETLQKVLRVKTPTLDFADLPRILNSWGTTVTGRVLAFGN
jgi:hypothetical protein